jgi:hypothetical protein
MSGQLFLAGKKIGRGEYAHDAGVALLGGGEDVIEVAPEFFERPDEFGVMITLAGERIDFFFFFDAVLQIGAEAVELVLRLDERFGLGAAPIGA